MDLFDVMRHEAFLSPVDLLQLEGLLWSIKRHDLLDIVIDYATQSKNVIYLQPASRTPVNGYKHVKFHVRGKKFGEMKTGDIRYLRTVAAITVLIPPSFVLIDGIDPSKSVVVTLQFPEQHANILKNILETREVEVAELIEFGVDSITIGETTFQITGQQEEHSDIFSEQDVDISIPWLWERRHKVQNLQKENEKHLNRIAELQQQMFYLQAENETFRTVCGTKNKILSEEKSKESIPVAVGVLDALNRFVSILEELTKENCKKNSILRVLQAHAILIASFCYQDVSILFQNILIQAKQMLNLMVMATVQSALQHFIGVNNAEAPIKALNEISEKITTDESKQLEKAYKLTEYEKEEVKTGSRSLLLVLLKKQSEENEDVPVREFLEKCLKIINRQDLLQEFFAKFEKYAKEDIEKAGKNRTGTEDMEAEANPPSEPKINDIAKNVRLILVKLSEIGQKLNHLPEFGKLDTELKKYPHCLYNKFLESSKFPL